MFNCVSMLQVITVYLECLEERDQALRQAGCAALAAMQVNNFDLFYPSQFVELISINLFVFFFVCVCWKDAHELDLILK